MKKKIMQILGNIFFYSIIIAILVSAYLFSVSEEENKSVFGYRFYEVLSGSMEPTIRKGELVIIKMTEPEDVEVGDIVTKSLTADGSETLTHRVIEIIEEEEGLLYFRTKGDNSPNADEPIPASAVIGIVKTHIPFAGYAIGFMKEHVIAAGVILISLVVIGVSLKTLLKKETAVDL